MKRQRLIIIILATVACVALIVGLRLNASGSGIAQESPPILTYPDLTPTATIAPQPVSPASVAGASLAQTGFDSPDTLSTWEIIDPPDTQAPDKSNWVVQDGVLVQNLTGLALDPSIKETMAVMGDPKWTNYTVSAKAYDQENATFGLVARRQGNSFYRYRVIANQLSGTPKQVLEKVVNGVATPLFTRDTPGYDQRAWHTVAMTVAGSNISVKLDGTVVAEATDATLTSGQAGLYTRALGGIRFDDFAVTTP